MTVSLIPMLEEKTVSLTLDVSHIVDVIDIKPLTLTYQIKQRHTYLDLVFSTEVDMTLACAKTLKPVPHHMHIQATITFGDLDEADFERTNTIELEQFVLGEIMAEKPVVVYHKDAKDVQFEKEKAPSPFEALLKK